MRVTFWTCLVLAVTTLQSAAAGLIVVHDPQFWPGPPPHPHPIPPPMIIRPHPVWAPLEVSSTKVEGKIRDQLAKTVVAQEFYNPNPRNLEGTFLFPVPKGAQIDKFTMEIDGKQVEAELLVADKARRIYEDIVRQVKDPALLEYAERDLFKVRIFPIEAHSRKRITLSYSELLRSDSGLVSYVFPLNTARYSAQPIKTLSVRLELESKRPLKSIYSPTHKVEVNRTGEHRATVGFEASNWSAEQDFQLFFAPEEGEFGLNLLSYRLSDEEGYFLLLASPRAESKESRAMPKDIVFVLDTSGSMAGGKLEQAKKALLFCVENLNEGDRFEIIRFSTEVEPLFDGLAKAEAEKRARAREFIKELKPLGGTAIDQALRKALAVRPEEAGRPYVVVFLTDGRPTVGNTDEKQIVDAVVKTKQGLTRIFCFGIGTDVNTHLLDGITEATKAFSQYVLPEEDLELKVSSFYTKIKDPALTEVKIQFPDGVRVGKAYPSPLPDLFRGQQLVMAGRYAGRGEGDIRIEGLVNGEKKSFAYQARFPEKSSDHDFIPRLWATRRVGYLLDEMRLRGENQELKDEVTELARKYSIVTPYTAYLILEDERRRDVPMSMRSLRGVQEDRQLAWEASSAYGNLGVTFGESAVAGARASYSLKAADAPVDAIRLSRESARINTPAVAPPASSVVVTRPSQAPATLSTQPLSMNGLRPSDDKDDAYARQSRFVGGRTFYLNGEQWIDAGVQSVANALRVRLPFASKEYFDFLAKHPEALSWVALGCNVQFVLQGKVYEIHPEAPVQK